MARSIRPVHTTADGDSVYALSVGDIEADQDLVGLLGAEAISEAIVRAVENAESAFGYPAARDLRQEKDRDILRSVSSAKYVRESCAGKNCRKRGSTMATLKKLRGKYLMVLLAMAGLVSSSLGIMTNAGGIFFSPIAAELGQSTAAVNLTLTICNLTFAVAGLFSARWITPKNYRPAVLGFTLVFAGSTALLSLCRGWRRSTCSAPCGDLPPA